MSPKSPQIIICYMPVLHQGYFQFLSTHKNADQLWLLGEEVMSQFPFFGKDVRKLEPSLVKKGLQAWGFKFEIKIASLKDLQQLPANANLILPDDEISHTLEADYAQPQKISVRFDPIFLRWNKHIIKKQQPISPDKKITTSSLDKTFISQAFAASAHSTNWWRHVGAVVVDHGKQLLVGWNHHLPSQYTHLIDCDMRSLFSSGVEIELASSIHAEAELIAQAARKGISLEGTDMYVTAFPCPVCAKQIAATGIKRIFFANGYSLIDGEDILKAAGVEIIQVKLSPEDLQQMQAADLASHIIKRS